VEGSGTGIVVKLVTNPVPSRGPDKALTSGANTRGTGGQCAFSFISLRRSRSPAGRSCDRGLLRCRARLTLAAVPIFNLSAIQPCGNWGQATFLYWIIHRCRAFGNLGGC